MSRRLVRPASFAQLRAALSCDPEAIVVGGAVGLMSAAMSPGWGNTNVDLSSLPLNWAADSRVGAMASLARVEGACGPGRRALAEAIATTATPAQRTTLHSCPNSSSWNGSINFLTPAGSRSVWKAIITRCGGKRGWKGPPD